MEVGLGTRLSLPILIDNPNSSPLSGTLSLTLPEGWRVLRGQGDFEAPARDSKAIEVIVAIPNNAKQDWHNLTIQASGVNKNLGQVKVRVHVAPSSLPQ